MWSRSVSWCLAEATGYRDPSVMPCCPMSLGQALIIVRLAVFNKFMMMDTFVDRSNNNHVNTLHGRG